MNIDDNTINNKVNRSMPILFIGHGTPMNAIEDNEFSCEWKELGKTLPHPKAILCISAHWEDQSSRVTAMDKPKTIHDFGGFPRELYAQQYSSPGSPAFAETIGNRIKEIHMDYNWGLDHGTWSFLKHMYPAADIPVIQLSIDRTKNMQSHYNLGHALRFLRKMDVLIIGSGNMIHNLWLVRAGAKGINTPFAYDWAEDLNKKMKARILSGDHDAMIHYHNLSEKAELAIPTEEHYIPLIYTLGLQEPEDQIEVFNDKIVAGSLSMTSFIFGNKKG